VSAGTSSTRGATLVPGVSRLRTAFRGGIPILKRKDPLFERVAAIPAYRLGQRASARREARQGLFRQDPLFQTKGKARMTP
ncbi:MAG: hypothetical protein AAB339_09490, partial [Elusimicrobiota bacterium]